MNDFIEFNIILKKLKCDSLLLLWLVFQGYRQIDIAKFLNIDSNNIRQKFYQIKKKIKKIKRELYNV